jgi:hypothetical protein
MSFTQEFNMECRRVRFWGQGMAADHEQIRWKPEEPKNDSLQDIRLQRVELVNLPS